MAFIHKYSPIIIILLLILNFYSLSNVHKRLAIIKPKVISNEITLESILKNQNHQFGLLKIIEKKWTSQTWLLEIWLHIWVQIRIWVCKGNLSPEITQTHWASSLDSLWTLSISRGFFDRDLCLSLFLFQR